MGILKDPVLKQTKSLCPECLAEIKAEVIERDAKIYMQKTCPAHGNFEAPHPWSRPEYYESIMRLPDSLYPGAAEGLVINLNSRCNQTCPFCFTRANEFDLPEPDIDRIMRTVGDFRGKIIYLSGGEPALRPDIFQIIKRIKDRGYKVVLFSNGKKLADPQFVRGLKKNGVDLVILQLDTLDDNQCLQLRGEKLLAVKREAVANLKKALLPVYIFTMIVRGVNEDQVGPLLDFAVKNNDCVKLINFNPVWKMGRFKESPELDASAILDKILAASTFSVRDFIDSGLFSQYLSGILSYFKKNKANRHCRCEMRCYAAVLDGKPVPLSRLFDLGRVNRRLQGIFAALNSRRPGMFLRESFLLAGILAGEFLRRRQMRRFLWQNFYRCFIRLQGPTGAGILSIIAGTFHTAANIDLDFVKTCNLYSDYPGDSSEVTSSCVRQIKLMREGAVNTGGSNAV